MDDIIDREGIKQCGGLKLGLRPRSPDRIFRNEVEQDVRVDQEHAQSPRVSAMISSVVIP